MFRSSAASAAMTDEQLMRRVQADDQRAFELLYDRYQDRAWRVVQVICGHSDRAECVLQEALVSIWRERADYRPERESVRAWSMGLLHRAADPDSGDRAAERPAPSDAAAGPGRGEADQAGPTGAAALSEFLGRLPAQQREIIVLAFYGGLTHAQIAQLLALPPGTVKGRMRMGLHKLRGVMDAEPAGDPPTTDL
jgi:RNA polymerase sigma-70 factor (ECF subfamily)